MPSHLPICQTVRCASMLHKCTRTEEVRARKLSCLETGRGPADFPCCYLFRRYYSFICRIGALLPKVTRKPERESVPLSTHAFAVQHDIEAILRMPHNLISRQADTPDQPFRRHAREKPPSPMLLTHTFRVSRTSVLPVSCQVIRLNPPECSTRARHPDARVSFLRTIRIPVTIRV